MRSLTAHVCVSFFVILAFHFHVLRRRSFTTGRAGENPPNLDFAPPHVLAEAANTHCSYRLQDLTALYVVKQNFKMSTLEYLRCAPKYAISKLNNVTSPHPTSLSLYPRHLDFRGGIDPEIFSLRKAPGYTLD